MLCGGCLHSRNDFLRNNTNALIYYEGGQIETGEQYVNAMKIEGISLNLDPSTLSSTNIALNDDLIAESFRKSVILQSYCNSC